jgi:hypothetical protein
MNDDDRRLLRELVTDAVAHEFAQQVGPLRERIQIIGGRVDQLNRDYGALRNMVQRHEQVIAGDPTIGMAGLVKQVSELASAVETLNENIDAWRNQALGLRKAIYVIGGVVGLPGIASALKLFGIVP